MYARNRVDSTDTADDDIVEVTEPMFDPFANKPLPTSPAPPPPSLTSPLGQHLVGVTPVLDDSTIFTYNEDGTEEPPPPVVVSPPGSSRGSAVRQSPDTSASSGSTPEGPSPYPYRQHLLTYHAEMEAEEIIQDIKNTALTLQHSSSPSRRSKNSYLPEGLKLTPSQQRGFPAPSRAPYIDSDDDDDAQYQSPGKAKPTSEIQARSPHTYVSELTQPKFPALKPNVVRDHYNRLLRDKAYVHAMHAGFLWQSIVGQHVRLPSHWWDGARGPPLGQPDCQWIYFGRETVKNHRVLNQLVKCRASGGRLLLHVIVQDLYTGTPVEDIAVGCFHPNAKGIRTTEQAYRSLEDCRDVWMGVRRRSADAVSAVDSLLFRQRDIGWDGSLVSRSPLGPSRRITNQNMRCVFGDKPPLETIFMAEDELYERLSLRTAQPNAPSAAVAPSVAILQEFVFA
jgi:hypothetical protein